MAGLLFPKQIPRPTDFQVADGDLEAGPQLRELLQGQESFSGFFRDRPRIRDQEIGKSLRAGPADPSSQLVEVR